MKERLQLDGILTVLNTPFTEDDKIDVAGLHAHVAYAAKARVAGFLVPAMASEVGKLTVEERRLIVSTVVEAAHGIPVIGGASTETPAERIQAARWLIGAGCSGVLASIPFGNKAQYEEDVRALDALRPGFLMIQDWDADGHGLPVPLVVRLFEEVETFRALKVEVVPAGPKYTEVLEATGGRLHVSGGWAVTQMIEALDRGVHAFMPTGLHRIYTRIYQLYTEGRRDEAQALHDRLLPVLAFSNQHLDISIHFFKRLLHAQGIYATGKVRPPILPFDATHERTAQALITQAVALEDALAKG